MARQYVYIICLLIAVLFVSIASINPAQAISKERPFVEELKPQLMESIIYVPEPRAESAQASSGFSTMASAVDSYELDDYPDLANTIFTNGSFQTHSFHVPGDEDWINFTGIFNTTYVIQTSNLTATTDTQITLYEKVDSDTYIAIGISNNINAPSNNNSLIRWFCKENGTYFVQIQDINNKSGSYTVAITNFTFFNLSDGDRFEIDNAYYRAGNQVPNRTFYNHTFINFTNDEDYINFTTTPGQIYVVETANTSLLTNTYLQLYGSNGTSYITANDDILASSDFNNTNSRIVFKADTTNYYARIIDAHTRSGNYSVSVFNVSAAQAYTNGTPVNITFSSTGTIEFAKFTAINGTTYAVQTSGASGVDTYMYLYDENLTILNYNDDINYSAGNFKSRIVWYASDVYNNTTMYVAVSDPYKVGGSFNITITNNTSTAGRDDFEPDSTMSIAQWVYTNGTSQNHSFYPIGEEDWAKFNATNGTSYIIETGFITVADTYMRLYDENRTLIAYHDDINTAAENYLSKIQFDCTEDGTYYIQISDPSLFGGNYSLSVAENGTLSTALLSPVDSKNVTRYGTFEFTVNITCNDGFCGNVTALLDPIKVRPIAEDSKVLEPIIEITAPSETTALSEEPAVTDASAPETYLVMLKPVSGAFGTASVSERRNTVEETETNFINTLPESVSVIRTYKSMSVVALNLTAAQLGEIKSNPGVVAVEKSKTYSLFLDNSTSQINATNASLMLDRYNRNLTGAGQTVCIIDSGVNYSHPALAHAYLNGTDFYNNDSDPMDDCGHGTHVAGIIVSNNTTYRGVAPGANIVSVKACDSTGDVCPGVDIYAGIDWCIDHAEEYNISVISMSLGGDGFNNTTDCEAHYPIFTYTINLATERDISVVAASGNNGYSYNISAPACIGNAISVGSVTKSDVVVASSNAASILDLLAPGNSITSTLYTGGFGAMSGTSMATPHVSGAILLMNQYYKSKTGSNLDTDTIVDYLNSTGKQINDTRNGFNFSRIDVAAAIAAMADYVTQKGIVPMNAGTPFFTTSQNPRTFSNLSCLSDMQNGDSCSVTWIINATGQLNSQWEFYVNATSSYDSVVPNVSDKVNITIVSIDMAPQINITSPLNDERFSASNFWINASVYSNTSAISSVQFRLENTSGANVTPWVSMNRSGITDTWYYSFNSSAITDGSFMVNVSAQTSAGNLSSAYVNITLDNQYPQITVNASQFLQYNQTPWLNYTVSDLSKNTTWYKLNNGAAVITDDTGASSVNATLDLLYPGLQNITVYANDSFSNTNSTVFTFYEFFLMNMSNWTRTTNLSIPTTTSITVSNSTGDITYNESVNISVPMNMTLRTPSFNLTVLNFPGQNATWAANPVFNLTENSSSIRTVFESYGTNVSKSISVYNMSKFISSSSLYNVSVNFSGNFTALQYCDVDTITSVTGNCTKLPTCTIYNGTSCYNNTTTYTTVYANHLSSIVLENDSTPPQITFNSPRNSSAYTANTETYNLTANITVSSDATACNMSVDGSANASMSRQGTSYFIGYIVKSNGLHNITVYCTDSANLNSSLQYFTINDSTGPSVSKAVATDADSAQITVTSDEHFYGVVYYSTSTSVAGGVSLTDCREWTNKSSTDSISERWSDNFDGEVEILNDLTYSSHLFSLTGLTASTTYYYGLCSCDYFNNCLESPTSSYFNFATTAADDEDPSPTGGGGSSSNNTTTTNKITAFWSVIPANTPTTWSVASTNIPLSQLVFTLSQAMEPVTIELINLGSSASSAGIVAAPNHVYSYLKFTTTAYGKVSSATMTFKVPQSWFTTNNYDSSKVRM
ncbi:MAG: S8 family serine peptidase, partial [Candidatus Nanoarchaeia archaeon]|nr:S8 family serine peptidase [Candidatus Nanoarchaeia archaeon]